MAQGQLYRVMITGFSKDNSEITKTEYLMVGLSIDDIKLKFPYVVDVSDFSRYRFEYVVKEPGRCHVLMTKIERKNCNQEDETIVREGGTAGIFQNVVNSPEDKKFCVLAKTVCFAKTEKHAIKKLGQRLFGGSESVIVSAEELAKDDGFAKPRDVSMFPVASFVRG